MRDVAAAAHPREEAVEPRPVLPVDEVEGAGIRAPEARDERQLDLAVHICNNAQRPPA